jgi:aldose 1-epimerase
MDMRLGSDLRRLVVFTNDTRDFIAIEPVSHVNNALGGGHADVGALGVRVLAPGESMSVTMTLEIQKRRHKQ